MLLKLWNHIYYKYVFITNENNLNNFNYSFIKNTITNKFDDTDSKSVAKYIAGSKTFAIFNYTLNT